MRWRGLQWLLRLWSSQAFHCRDVLRGEDLIEQRQVVDILEVRLALQEAERRRIVGRLAQARRYRVEGNVLVRPRGLEYTGGDGRVGILLDPLVEHSPRLGRVDLDPFRDLNVRLEQVLDHVRAVFEKPRGDDQ